MFSKTPSWAKQLTSSLAENPVWQDLFNSVSSIVTEVIDEPRWALSRIREAEVVQRGDWLDTPIGKGKVTFYRRELDNINKEANSYTYQDYVEIQVDGKEFVTLPVQVLHDRETLINSAKNLGFDYFSSSIQDDDYARIVSYAYKFWNANGGDHFISFMGMLKRTRFEIEQLWTPEIGDPGLPSNNPNPANEFDYYKELLRRSEYLPKVWQNYNFDPSIHKDQGFAAYYYPTSHVELGWDMLEHPSIDKLDILSLFYLLAPIHLVLERFVQTIYVEIDYKAAVAPILYTIPQRSLKIEV